MTAIRIEVEPEVAKAFQSANKIDRQKLQLLVNGWLKQPLQRRSLDEIIDQMQAEAKTNGLTQAILDEVVSVGDEFTVRPNNYCLEYMPW